MTGLRPIYLVRQSVLATRRGFVALRLWLLRRRMRKADLKEQLEISQRKSPNSNARSRKSCARNAALPEPALSHSRPRRNLPIARNRKWSIPLRFRRSLFRRAKKPSLADLKRAGINPLRGPL